MDVGLAAGRSLTCATLDDMPPARLLLTSRRHVDLQRTSSAVCRPA